MKSLLSIIFLVISFFEIHSSHPIPVTISKTLIVTEKSESKTKQEKNDDCNSDSWQEKIDYSNPNAIIYEGKTGLGLAAYFQDFIIVEKLLLSGADPNQMSSYRTPLIEAITGAGYTRATNYDPSLPEYAQDWVTIFHPKERTAEIVELLLKHGANPNQTSNFHSSALEYATYGTSSHINTRIIHLLLQAGANPFYRPSPQEKSFFVHTTQNENHKYEPIQDIFRPLLAFHSIAITQTLYQDKQGTELMKKFWKMLDGKPAELIFYLKANHSAQQYFTTQALHDILGSESL
ncbi:hypothetical protein HYV11_02640 [Candidatus Dependentiae bacterium]|nr:hypothetical protein [Candidatus Dependentiae bacterium]